MHGGDRRDLESGQRRARAFAAGQAVPAAGERGTGQKEVWLHGQEQLRRMAARLLLGFRKVGVSTDQRRHHLASPFEERLNQAARAEWPGAGVWRGGGLLLTAACGGGR